MANYYFKIYMRWDDYIMILNNEDKIKLKYDPNIRVKRVELSTGVFYAKYCYDEEIFKELLGKKIFDMVGIKCPNYYMFKEEHCVLSEDLDKYKNFYSTDEIIEDVRTINDLKIFFEYQLDKYNRYKNIDELMFQIYIMHFIDILFSNVDRHTGNYGFSLNDDGTSDLIVFDHGELLDCFDKATRPPSFPSANSLDFTSYSKEAECRYFIKNADDSVIEIMKVILSRFNFNTVRLLMKEIEKDTNYKFSCKNKLLLGYLKNYLVVYKVFSKCCKERNNVKNDKKLSKIL